MKQQPTNEEKENMPKIILPMRYRVHFSRYSSWIAILSLCLSLILFVHNQILIAKYHESLYNAIDFSSENDRKDFEKDAKAEQIKFYQTNFNLDLRTLNVTRSNQKETLMFNRVPKAGGQSVMQLLRSLSHLNGFTFHKDRTQKSETIKMTDREQNQLTKLVDLFKTPTAYAKHVCYINFTNFAKPQPIYINMVRDPVERVISWFYYVRAPWYFVERKVAFPHISLPSSAWLRKDYETCVENNDPECTYTEGESMPNYGQLTEFFCGQEDKCTGFNTDYALQRAKENVEKNYAVVGVLEEMNMTLAVLEHYLPLYFTNASQVYWDNVKTYTKVNRNMYKPPVTLETKNTVRKNFSREIEFYEFCKTRLYKQYAALYL